MALPLFRTPLSRRRRRPSGAPVSPAASPAAAVAVVTEALESRRMMAFSAAVNFQPAGAAAPAGYVVDSGAVFGSRGNGLTFGWNIANATSTRDRNAAGAPDQRYDTLTHTQLKGADKAWEIAVPNGTYQVRLVGGDPNFTDSTIRFNAEETLVAAGQLSAAQRYVDGSATVHVTDGRLTISNASGAVNNKINFIEITGGDANPTPSVSVAATDAGAAEAGANSGKFTITRAGGPLTSSLLVNYAIGGSATNGTDYNALFGSATIPAGKTSVTITVTPKNDGLVEGGESVVLTLTGGPSYVIGTSAATVNIADDDDQPPPQGNEGWPTSWQARAELSKQRQEGRGGVMDGNVWVFGGFMSGSSTGTQQVDFYNVASDTWTTLKNYGPMPHTHTSVVADHANHAFYLLGGLFGKFPGEPTNRVWRFDTIGRTWSELPGMPENHEGGGAALVNGRLHYIGGSLDDRVTDTARHISIDLNNLAAGWRAEPDMPNGRAHFSTVVLGGKIYCIGGQYDHDQHTSQLALVHRYDPGSRGWEQLADLPTPKSHAEASTFVRNGRIIMAGGQIGRFGSTDEVVSYDPGGDKWTTIGKLPTPLQSGFAQMVGDKIVVTTGNRGDNTPRGDTWVGELS